MRCPCLRFGIWYLIRIIHCVKMLLISVIVHLLSLIPQTILSLYRLEMNAVQLRTLITVFILIVIQVYPPEKTRFAEPSTLQKAILRYDNLADMTTYSDISMKQFGSTLHLGHLNGFWRQYGTLAGYLLSVFIIKTKINMAWKLTLEFYLSIIKCHFKMPSIYEQRLTTLVWLSASSIYFWFTWTISYSVLNNMYYLSNVSVNATNVEHFCPKSHAISIPSGL